MLLNLHKLLNCKLIKFNNRFLHQHVCKMNKAYLRRFNDSNEFEITFQYNNPNLKVDRRFNFCRQLKENVTTFLSRVEANVDKVVNKKNKRKKKTDDQVEDKGIPVNAKLSLNGVEIDGDVICEELFQSASNEGIILKVLEQQYNIIIDSPWVDSLRLPSSILANFPVYPSKFETVFTEKLLSDFVWYKSANKVDWFHVGEGYVFTPENRDINHYLKLQCTPKNKTAIVGPAAEAISEVKVEASPGYCPFENRHQFTKQRVTDKEFRVVTYNILADLYCDSEFSRNTLYSYCPSYALNIDYRKQLILKELLGYNADIICLQELDKKVYFNDFEPVFSSLNYDSTFTLKGGVVAEGLGCFFNRDRFKHLESNCIILSEELNKNPLFADIWGKISENKKLAERILQRTTAVQTTCLQSTDYRSELLVVANTHLYFHPDADHIRLLQGGLAMRYVMDVIEKLKAKTKLRTSLIFCGDFNSVPECGIYQLYTTGIVSENCADWESNKEEAVKDLSFFQPYALASAYGAPRYTNYTVGFSGCLDYIYYDKSRLEVTQVIPLPSDEEVKENVALPSIVFPSDHISLITDLKWL